MLQLRHLSCVASLVVTTWLCMVIISIQMTGQDGSQPMTLLPVRKYYNFNGFPIKTMFYRNMWILWLDDGSCKWYSEKQTPSVPYSEKMSEVCTDYHHSISFLCPGSCARISPAKSCPCTFRSTSTCPRICTPRACGMQEEERNLSTYGGLW